MTKTYEDLFHFFFKVTRIFTIYHERDRAEELLDLCYLTFGADNKSAIGELIDVILAKNWLRMIELFTQLKDEQLTDNQKEILLDTLPIELLTTNETIVFLGGYPVIGRVIYTPKPNVIEIEQLIYTSRNSYNLRVKEIASAIRSIKEVTIHEIN
jgi:hypothetical protein